MTRPYALDGETGLVMAGLPTLESVAPNGGDEEPKALLDILKQTNPCDLHQRLGGTWSIARYHKRRLTAFSDFSGLNSIFYTKRNGLIAVSNKASLLVPIAQPSRKGHRDQINARALSWLPTTTMIQGHSTAFQGVMKVAPGHFCVVDQNGLRIRKHRVTFFDPISVADSEIEAFVHTRAHRLVERAKWYFDRGIRFASHLTGGKDSRTILAVLHASGLTSSLEQLTTVGAENNGDVIISRVIAKALGLSRQHDVRARGKSTSIRSVEDVKRGFAHNIAKYDGQLTPYDGAQRPTDRFPEIAFFSGAGGEIYRPKAHQFSTSLNAAFLQFINWSAPHDPLRILTRPARLLQRHAVRQRVREMLNDRVHAQHTKYYIDHRLSNWGCGHWQGSLGNQVPLLLDLDLCRLLFRDRAFGETIHYLIIKALAPTLLEIPFYGERWAGPTRLLAAHDRRDIEPLARQVQNEFPWQFAIYQTHRDAMITDICAKPLGPFRHAIHKRRLSNLVVAAPANSAQIKSLYGLFTGRSLPHAAALRDPDTPHQKTRFTGNLSPLNHNLGAGNAPDFVANHLGF